MIMDSLGDRMKSYERDFSFTLTKKTPVLIRVDGKAFHTYTRECDRPFDQGFIGAMWETAKVLCAEIQGAQLAFVQSDEISVLIHNYKTRESGSWFDNKLQKMVSVAAGIASGVMTLESDGIFTTSEHGVVIPMHKRACFDARVWVLPESEVCNYFYWRQADWTRNSVQMLARSLYSHKQLFGKNNSELQDLCMERGYNWNDLPIYLRRGACVVKKQYEVEYPCICDGDCCCGEECCCGDKPRILRTKWMTDKNIPIFTQDRDYIDRHLEVEY